MVNYGTEIALDVTCIACHACHTLTAQTQDYQDWCGGKLIQTAMPYLTADEREFLISGICGECYDALCDAIEINKDLETFYDEHRN